MMTLATGSTILPRHRFTVDQYLAMGEAGIFGEDDRVELIDGEIIDMTPIGYLHASGVRCLISHFSGLPRGTAILDVQNPIRLTDIDHPQPDLMVLRWVPDLYRRRPVTPADVLLLVEVSDSSLQHDRQVKLPRYAAAGIPEVWLVDLNGARIEVYRRPADGRYTEMAVYEGDQLVAPAAFPDFAIPANEILP